MTPSQRCIDMIKANEGCILHPYHDQAGVPTIGYGTILYPKGTHVQMSDPPITQDFANICLNWQVKVKADAVNSLTNGCGLNQNQFDSLVDFCYNAGTGALAGSTLLKRIKANPADLLIRDAFMMWDKAHVDGQLVELADLKKRRAREADLYFTPISSL